MEDNTQQTLELKHIAPYLPYGLTAQFTTKDSVGKHQVYEMKASNIEYVAHSCKPILRPLSDLTKEIEHNGERLVPLNKMGWSENKHKTFFEIFGNRITDIPYSDIEFLFSLHFDVFGLIEKGLAININDLNK